jgi:hypothetical protein
MTTLEYWMNNYTQPNSQNVLNSIKATIFLMGIEDKYIKTLLLKNTNKIVCSRYIKCRINGIEYKLLNVFSKTGNVELEDYKQIPGTTKNRFITSIVSCGDFQYF